LIRIAHARPTGVRFTLNIKKEINTFAHKDITKELILKYYLFNINSPNITQTILLPLLFSFTLLVLMVGRNL